MNTWTHGRHNNQRASQLFRVATSKISKISWENNVLCSTHSHIQCILAKHMRNICWKIIVLQHPTDTRLRCVDAHAVTFAVGTHLWPEQKTLTRCKLISYIIFASIPVCWGKNDAANVHGTGMLSCMCAMLGWENRSTGASHANKSHRMKYNFKV